MPNINELAVVSTSKLDNLGRLVIPKDIRRRAGLTVGSLVDVCYDGEAIIVRPSNIQSEICRTVNTLKTQLELLRKGGGDCAKVADAISSYLEDIQGVTHEYFSSSTEQTQA